MGTVLFNEGKTEFMDPGYKGVIPWGSWMWGSRAEWFLRLDLCGNQLVSVPIQLLTCIPDREETTSRVRNQNLSQLPTVGKRAAEFCSVSSISCHCPPRLMTLACFHLAQSNKLTFSKALLL